MESVVQRIEQIAHKGVFGNVKVLHVENSSKEGKGEQFASELMFLQITLEALESNSKDRIVKLPVVVKMQPPEVSRLSMGTDDQFANEVYTYSTILPVLGADKDGLAPKMYYGSASKGKTPEEDIIILEDLRPCGYKVVNETFLDYEHVILAMRKLGEYHGCSYRLKKKSFEEVQRLSESIIPRKFIGLPLFDAFFLRGMKSLLDDSPKYSIVNRAYSKISRSVFDLFNAVYTPEEPFAVIIHGDFTKNNIFFSYENDRVADVKFFDFATPSYADPAIDLSVFLYLNVSGEMRDEHWDDFLQAYWKGVTSIEADPGFGFNEFTKNFAKRAVWGYRIASFYLPMLLFPEVLLVPEAIFSMSDEEQYDWGMNKGGDKVTRVTSSIAQHLLDRGYLEEFLLNLKY